MNGNITLRAPTAVVVKLGRTAATLIATCMLWISASSCGDDDDGGPVLSPAQRTGVGAACTADTDCLQTAAPLKCLNFKGGYCGLQGCTRAEDCPLGSACVTHDDGQNYCFLVCIDKPECNSTRPIDVEANCSSSTTFVDGSRGKKACLPPS